MVEERSPFFGMSSDAPRAQGVERAGEGAGRPGGPMSDPWPDSRDVGAGSADGVTRARPHLPPSDGFRTPRREWPRRRHERPHRRPDDAPSRAPGRSRRGRGPLPERVGRARTRRAPGSSTAGARAGIPVPRTREY